MLHEDLGTIKIISLRIFLIMRNISDKICRENQNTFSVQYRGAGKSLARPGRKQSTATKNVDVHLS
jgi:hypothetical protein